MIEFISNNFSLIISVVSLGLSIYNFFYLIFVRYKKVSITLCSYTKEYVNGEFHYTFRMIINNRSQLPISINNININGINCKNTINYIYKVTSKTGGTITDERKIYPMELPINLSSLMSVGGFALFEFPTEIDFNNIDISINTNRGLIKECNFTFSDNFKEITSFDF